MRQIARYEAGEQQPVLSAAVALADALDISLARLAARESEDPNLSGEWWASWETSRNGVAQIATQTLEVAQRGEQFTLDATTSRPVAEGGYAWQGELRFWDTESLIGWYRSTQGAVRSKGAMYFALHPHGEHAWGRWVGLSYDGLVVTGWSGLARDQGTSAAIVQRLIDTQGGSHGSPS
ncbi:MAG: hypothetical protein ACRCYQ_08925 [Nocardioides sp.]